MNTPTVQAALEQVLDEMSKMSPEELRADLDAHKDGPISAAQRDINIALSNRNLFVPPGSKVVTVEQLQELTAAAYNMAAAQARYYGSNCCSVGYKQHARDYYKSAEKFDALISTILQQE